MFNVNDEVTTNDEGQYAGTVTEVYIAPTTEAPSGMYVVRLERGTVVTCGSNLKKAVK